MISCWDFFVLFCRNLVVKQVALMVMLTRASRFLGTMWYYYSLLLTFTSITFFHYISGMFASCNAPGAVLGGRGRQGKNRRKDCEQPLRTDCLKYKQLDIIVEFLLEHCKELVRQVPAVCSSHHLQKLYLCGLGVLCAGSSSGGSATWSRPSTASPSG